MARASLEAVEGRTRELGQRLYEAFHAYRPPLPERAQDGLMLLLMRDQRLRNRLLRLVDVLAALGGGRRVVGVFRQYFGVPFPEAPPWLRLLLRALSSPLVPPWLLAAGLRWGTRFIASRFVVSPRPRTVEAVLGWLESRGRYPSFDLLGEAVVSREEALAYRQGYLDLLARLGGHPLAGRRTPGGAPCLEVSLKLSSLVPQPLFNPADPEGTLREVRPALEEVFESARRYGIGVTVDAEQFAYRDLTWHIFRETVGPGTPLAEWPDAGMVVQAYLRDARGHAGEVLDFARRRGVPFRVRLVKGAYWDYEVIVAEQNGWPVPVFRAKGETDITFEQVARLLLEGAPAVRLAVASHNLRAHAYAEALAEALGLPPGSVEHQTLYRTMEGLSQALPRMGWVARDYVPVGELIPGMAYLMRRILENTSQVGFLTQARLHGDPEALLAPPAPGPEDTSYRRKPHPTGFVNTPVARLFHRGEREAFRAALEETRSRWGREYPLRLGAREVKGERVVASLSPSHPDPSSPVARFNFAGRGEAEQAVEVAVGALTSWRERPVEERVAIGLRASRLLRQRREEVAAWVVHEGGRTWQEALADVEEAADHIEWNARQVMRLAPVIRARFRPRGVVACIAPWNFPTALPAGMVSGALLAGNTVVLKSAEQTPLVAQALVEVFHKAGVPPEALIHLPGPGETMGAFLVESPEVDMVAFTGSRAVGVGIYERASTVAPVRGGVKRVVAEMGGKNAILVFPDADMDEAVLGILRSAFGHAGQKCSACSRVLVHREVYPRLLERLVQGARSLVVGPADDPATFINPLIDEEARERVLAYARIARGEGRVLLDALDRSDRGQLCLGPLLVEVEPGRARTARVAQEEIFGPILAVIPFSYEEEAVSLVNSTVYALTLGIFSRSPATVRRMVRECHAGNIYVNREITGARVGVEPFGGFWLSGTGPKAGGEDYPLAFLTRREGYRGGEAPRWEGHQGGLPRVRPWDGVGLRERLFRLTSALRRLVESPGRLRQAIADWKRLDPEGSEVARLVGRTVEVASAVLGCAGEIDGPQPTLAVPGQRNFILWETPRGQGLVAVDEGAEPASLVGMVLGALLAGNGVVVAPASRARGLATLLMEALLRAGVPPSVVALAGEGSRPEDLARGPVHFAAVDLGLEATRSLYRALGHTDEAGGQRWLKALISVAEGPRPGEEGFLRTLALPKTVAVRTLRHGADLELL